MPRGETRLSEFKSETRRENSSGWEQQSKCQTQKPEMAVLAKLEIIINQRTETTRAKFELTHLRITIKDNAENTSQNEGPIRGCRKP